MNLLTKMIHYILSKGEPKWQIYRVIYTSFCNVRQYWKNLISSGTLLCHVFNGNFLVENPNQKSSVAAVSSEAMPQNETCQQQPLPIQSSTEDPIILNDLSQESQSMIDPTIVLDTQ